MFFVLRISVLLALTLVPAEAQTETARIERASQPWRWVGFGEEDGLEAARILDIADLGEVVWAATDQGLFRCDGWTWSPFGPEQGVARAPIASLSAGGDGEIWLIVQGRLLCGDERGFASVPLSGELEGMVPLQVAVGSAGEVSLVVRDRPSGTVRLARGSRSSALALTGLPEDWSDAARLFVARTASGRVWLASELGVRVLEHGAWVPWIETPDRGIHSPQGFHETASGHGMCGLRTTSGATRTWTWSAGTSPSLVRDQEAWLVQASALGEDGTGLQLLESRECLLVTDGAWRLLDHAPETLRSADFLGFRPNGDLWVATKAGLQLCRLSSERLSHWREPAAGSPLNRVEEILVARDGSGWIATFGGVVARRADGSRLDIPPLDTERHPQLTGIAEDAAGRIWVSSGASLRGLACWDGQRWRHVDHDADGRPLGLIHKVRPSKDGSLWCLTLSEDLEAVSAERGSVQRIVGDSVQRWPASDELPACRFYDVAETLDGAVWFGTSRGLACRREGRWQSLGPTEGLLHQRVFRLAATSAGEIVFANCDAGLGRVGRDGSITYPENLPTALRTHVVDLVLDAEERLWLSAHGGLFLLRDGHWSCIDFAPGSTNPSMWPVLADSDRVYAGTADGLYILSLDEMNEAPPRVELDPPAIDGDRALVRWSARAAWQGSSGSWLESRHRLDEGAWSPWDPTREIELVDLASGDHVFEVQSKGILGQVGENAGRVSFRVPPPLFLRPAFGLPIAGLSLALLALALVASQRRRRDALRLRRSESEHRRLMEQASDVILIGDESGRVTLANPKAEELVGVELEALIGLPLASLFTPADAANARDDYASLAHGTSIVRELELQRRGGPPLPVEASIKRLVDGRLQAILRDLSERRRLEHERRAWEKRVSEAQHLQSLGLLAGGIAHDFNNLLMVIQGSSEELDTDGALERLRGAVRRASTLTQQLLVYAGRGPLQTMETDLRLLVSELADCLAASLPSGVVLRKELAGESVPVRVDAARIGQLLYHLMANASEAFEARGGTISVEVGAARTGDAILSPEHWRAIPADGSWSFLRVRDDGAGMSPQVLERIFEPFYSTRGEGRGMGLAVVRGIVLSHRGHVRVESTSGRGSVLTVLLPRAERRIAADRGIAAPAAWTGRGAILVVDDEDSVREITTRMLERAGYRVIVARDGREALGRLEEDPREVACALIDLTMPGWNGIETMRALRERKPELPVLLVSGYSALDLESLPAAGGETSLLHKPFTLQELEERLRQLLQVEVGLPR